MRPIRLSTQSTILGVHSLLIAVGVAALGVAGCLRLGYDEHVDSGHPKRDAGTHDTGPTSTGGHGGAGGFGAGGAGGAAGMSPVSGAHDAAAGGNDESDAEVIEIPTDAGTEAGVIEVPDDAGAADGGSVVVSPKCPELPGVAFCDGFEDPDFSRWAYTIRHNATLTRSTMRAHSGTTSLLATTGPAAQRTEARWATDVLANQKSGDAWMRFYDWVPGTVVVTRHFSVGVMSEIAMPYAGFELRILPSLVDINSSGGVFQSAMSFPRDRWVCVEMHVRIDPSVGVYEAYVDGVLAVRSPPMNTLPADGFTSAEVGVHWADPSQGPVEVYVDDVVVGTSRIPCD